MCNRFFKITKILPLLIVCCLTFSAEAKKLRIGVTLHPYYSFAANIVQDKADVIPMIPVGFNPHAYEVRAEEIKQIGGLDVIIVNGVGHDDFASRMIAASEKPDIPVINANKDVPILTAGGSDNVINSHTFVSISAAIQQVQTIARELGKFDPENAETYMKNARLYTQKLRKIRADALSQLDQVPTNTDFRVATIHGAYDYMLREFGLSVTATVEPAHGIEPSPAQLAKTIDTIRNLNVQVIFSEINFPSTYVDTIQRETGVRLYPLSHISNGEYTAEKFETEIKENYASVIRAINYAIEQKKGKEQK